MGENLFKIVFRGEVGFDFDQDEVKGNLQRFCGFSRETTERFFSGGSFVLKKELDEPTAAKYLDALQKLGAMAEVVPMTTHPPAGPNQVSRPSPLPSPPPSGQFKCPACGQAQEQGLACVACGVYFPKLAANPQRPAPVGPGTVPGMVGNGHVETPQGPSGQADLWPETRTYLINCLALGLPLAGFSTILGKHFMVLGFIVLPAAFMFFILYQVVARDQNLAAGLAQHFDLEFDQSGKDDWKRAEFPRVTYGMVLLILVLYYGFSIHLKPATLLNHFSFLPAAPNFWNIPLSAVTAQFLHAGGWQLWGSAVFLWIFGTAVEKRLGSLRFFVIFLLTGMAAGELAVLAHSLLFGSPLHGLGSSGGIAGLIGIFAVCCRNRTLAFPLPLLGVISLAYPARLIVRIDALAVIGLFFFCGLAGGIDARPESAAVLVQHLVNVGGFFGGVLIGLFLDPEKLRGVETAWAGVGGKRCAP